MLQSITGCYGVLQSIIKYYKVLESINLAHLLGPILSLLHEGLKLKLNKRVNIWGKITNKKIHYTSQWPFFITCFTLMTLMVVLPPLKTSPLHRFSWRPVELWILGKFSAQPYSIFDLHFCYFGCIYSTFSYQTAMYFYTLYCVRVIFFNKRCFLFDFNG